MSHSPSLSVNDSFAKMGRLGAGQEGEEPCKSIDRQLVPCQHRLIDLPGRGCAALFRLMRPILPSMVAYANPCTALTLPTGGLPGNLAAVFAGCTAGGGLGSSLVPPQLLSTHTCSACIAIRCLQCNAQQAMRSS